jgi:ribosomal protein L37AE/L43A
VIYQYYCGYCARMTKYDHKTDIVGCYNCGRIARFDGAAPKAQQNLQQSFRSHVVTTSVEAYNRGE